MTLSIGQLNYNVYLGLGSPDASVCDHQDIHFAVRNEVLLANRELGDSDNNQRLAVTVEFTPTASPYDISTLLTGNAQTQTHDTIAWIEIKRASRWEPMRVVNKVLLEEMYIRQVNAASIYGDKANRQYVEFSYPVAANSTQAYRIWFDEDLALFSLTNAFGVHLPDSLAPYIELRAQNTLIPRIVNRLANQIESEEMRKLVELQMLSLNNIKAQNSLDLVDWRQRYLSWKNRTRTAQNQSRLPSKSSRGFYGQ